MRAIHPSDPPAGAGAGTRAAPAAMPAARRLRIIWNPQAGSKAGLPTNGTSEEELRSVMKEFGLGDDLVVSHSEAEALAAVGSAVAQRYDTVVAAGGDGTTSAIAFELLGTETSLGILPLGSAMNVARSLGIPRDLRAAAAVLAQGETRAIDVGEANGIPFLEVGSVGLNAAILGEAQRFDQGDGSMVSLVTTVLRFQPARMTIRLDERTVATRALMVAVANAPFTGLGLTLAPDARLDDGLLDVRVYNHFSKWELIRHLASIVAGHRAYAPKIRTYRSRSVRIEANHPRPVRVDATDLGETPVEFRVRRRALRVIVPASGRRAGTAPVHDRAS